MLFKILALEYVGGDDLPDASFRIDPKDSTVNIAAGAVVNMHPNPAAQQALMNRYQESGAD